MGVMGDTIDEFKHAKTPEKVVIVGASVAVLGIALYLHYKNSQQTGPAQAQTGASQGQGQTGLQYSAGQYPYLPSGTQGIYDPNGNLVGFQQGNTPSPTPTPTPTPTPGPGPGHPPPGPCKPGVFYAIGSPCNPHGPLGGSSAPLFSGNPPFGYNYGRGAFQWTDPHGKLWTVGYGPQGRVWGVPGKVSSQQWANTPIATGQKQLLYVVPTAGATPKQGGGAFGTAVLGQRRTRIAPTREGRPYVAHVYARRAS